MNAINIAGNMIQLTATSKLSLVAATLAFGMLCIYKLITSERWISMFAGVLLLVSAAYVLTGCAPTDPMRNAQAQDLANRSSIALSQNSAQITAAQKAETEAALERERSRQMQSEQAILASQQAIAQAQANAQIAATIAQASKPDNTLLMVVILGAFGLLGIIIWRLLGQTGRPLTSTPATLRPMPQILTQPAYIQIPTAVQAQAARYGGEAQWNGERWLIVDDDGRILARQRLLTSN